MQLWQVLPDKSAPVQNLWLWFANFRLQFSKVNSRASDLGELCRASDSILSYQQLVWWLLTPPFHYSFLSRRFYRKVRRLPKVRAQDKFYPPCQKFRTTSHYLGDQSTTKCPPLFTMLFHHLHRDHFYSYRNSFMRGQKEQITQTKTKTYLSKILTATFSPVSRFMALWTMAQDPLPNSSSNL